MNHQNDYQIVETVRAGATAQYAVLVKRYERLTFTLAFRMMKNREDAEEVTQDVFVKAYQALASFKGDAKFSSWLYRITYNRCLDLLKKKKREPTSENIELLSDLRHKQLELVLDKMEREQQEKLLKQAIEKLDPEEAFIISVFYYKEHSIAEIAEMTDLSESNIKIKLYRSRKKLFKLLQGMPAFNKRELL